MQTARARAKTLTAAGLLTMLFGALLVTAPGVGAARDGVTICHRTNSVEGPYQVNTVSYDGANGDLEAHGGNDHDEHLGDAFDFEADPDVEYPTPRNGDQWGDIIPPIPYGDGQSTDGLNWDEAGQAIYFGKPGGVLGVDAAVCTAPVTPDTFSATVAKTNNANGAGDYEDDETAAAAAADVPFHVVLTNTGTGDLKVDGLSDTWPGRSESLDLLDLGTGELVCTTPDGGDGDSEPDEFVMGVDAVIPAGAVITCLFTLDDYSPAAGGSVTNTVTLDTEEAADASDTSIVRTPSATPTQTATVVKENNADGLGDYGDDETAPTASADVPFEVVISNTGTGALTVDGLSDDWAGLDEPVDLLGLGAGELVCTTPDGDDGGTDPDPFPMAAAAEIPAGAVVTCRFTLEDYSPAAGGSVTNTVTLDTEEAADASDTSIVRTPRRGDCTSNCGPIVIPDPPEEATEPSSLTVAKVVTGDVPDDGWSFSFDNDVLGEFELTDEGSSTSDEVEEGIYTITEASSDDADLTSIECTGDGEVVDLDAGTVTVEVEEGDSITCTFTNDFAEVEPGGVAKPKPTEQGPSVAPATDRGGVLGAQAVRSLPRTGSSSQTLATVGAVLILFGAVMTFGSRRKLALER